MSEQISLHRSDPDQNQLKKSLSIAFVEEAGVDAGGLKKEWFLQLVLQQFDPVFGMFVTKEGSSNCWFQPGSISTVEEFELVGIVVGLAIYHSVTLAIPLPPVRTFFHSFARADSESQALYKKLCGERLSLADLAPIDPVLEKGLRTLLEFEGDVEETFSRDFVVSQGMPWEIVEHELVEGGKERAVTNENRGGVSVRSARRIELTIFRRIRRPLRRPSPQHLDQKRIFRIRFGLQLNPRRQRAPLHSSLIRNRINPLRRIDSLLHV